MKKGNFERNSRQRAIILEELRKLRSHPNASAIYEAVRRRLPRISLGTVYRNLDLLVQKGIIRKLQVGGPLARFDGDTDSHYHICCTICDRIDDIYNTSAVNIDFNRKKFINGYEVRGFNVGFYGICPNCQGKNKSSIS